MRMIGGHLDGRELEVPEHSPAIRAPEPVDWTDLDPDPASRILTWAVRQVVWTLEHPCVRGALVHELRRVLVLDGHRATAPELERSRADLPHEVRRGERLPLAAPFWWTA